MIRDLFKIKLPVKIIAVVFVLSQSCNSGKDADVKDQADDDKDTISIHGYDSSSPYIKPGNNASNHYVSPAEAAKEERRNLILMQIDSTYTAISLLDDAKNEMTATSPAELTAAERNKKSKAIFNINILQNELTRALDASILANLRLKTDELMNITAELQRNVTHLQTVTEKLNKATQCIGRLTNILALGLSKGIIKPFTPKNASVESVKETALAN